MSRATQRAAAAALILLGFLNALAASASAARPDFSGFWRMETRVQGGGFPPPPGGRPGSGAGLGPGPALWQSVQDHLQPWAQQEVEKLRAALIAGEPPLTNSNQCLPWALPGGGIPGGPAYSMNLVQTPSELAVMFQEDHQSHIVYLDQQHSAPLVPSFFGESVGHWDKQTLVVDSVGFNNRTTILDGVPHTDALHVTERLHLAADGVLIWDSTIEDAGALSSPISMSARYVRAAPFQEFVCAQNNHEAAPGAAP